MHEQEGYPLVSLQWAYNPHGEGTHTLIGSFCTGGDGKSVIYKNILVTIWMNKIEQLHLEVWSYIDNITYIV